MTQTDLILNFGIFSYDFEMLSFSDYLFTCFVLKEFTSECLSIVETFIAAITMSGSFQIAFIFFFTVLIVI